MEYLINLAMQTNYTQESINTVFVIMIGFEIAIAVIKIWLLIFFIKCLGSITSSQERSARAVKNMWFWLSKNKKARTRVRMEEEDDIVNSRD